MIFDDSICTMTSRDICLTRLKSFPYRLKTPFWGFNRGENGRRHFPCIDIVSVAQVLHKGGSRISGKGVHIYKGAWVRFADVISFFLKISWKWNNLVSLRTNYLIFIGYLKTGLLGHRLNMCIYDCWMSVVRRTLYVIFWLQIDQTCQELFIYNPLQ